MANPVLKKLSKPGIPDSEIADLLEKHIGMGSNESHCRDAFEALRRIKNHDSVAVARVVSLLVSNGSNYCEMVRQAAEQFRCASANPYQHEAILLPKA